MIFRVSPSLDEGQIKCKYLMLNQFHRVFLICSIKPLTRVAQRGKQSYHDMKKINWFCHQLLHKMFIGYWRLRSVHFILI